MTQYCDPELVALVANHDMVFELDWGMAMEETAFRDPRRFYEHTVSTLLRNSEEEKLRLLSNLMAKYRGREHHLINKPIKLDLKPTALYYSHIHFIDSGTGAVYMHGA